MDWPIRMTLTMAPLVLVASLYAGLRLAGAWAALRRRPPAPARWAALAVILILNLWPLALAAAYLLGWPGRSWLEGGHPPLADHLLVYPFWWGFVLALELAPWLLALELAGLGAWLAHAEGWRRRLAWIRLALVAALSLVVGGRMAWDTGRVRLVDETVAVRGLPAEFEDLDLLLIGDVQADRYTGAGKLDRFLAAARAARPDLALFAGDLVTEGTTFLRPALAALGRVRAPGGRAAVMGDHDFWADPGAVRAGLRNRGWDFLENEHRLYDWRGRRVLVTGVRYIYSDRVPPARLRALLAAAPAADLRILLVHQPAAEVIAAADAAGYHLVVAGHTHGGQIVFHLFGWPVTPTQLENDFYSGNHPFGRLRVVVTNGVGLTLAPVRYGAPAEITRIRLRPS
jgi:hypothetical protein